MTKIFAIIPFLILFNNPVGDPADLSPVSAADISAIAGGRASADQLYVEYEYWFQGGVSVELQVFGSGKAYYHKKVNSKDYQDAINYAHQKGIRISPYQWSLANCEYGNYEIFMYADLTQNQIREIADRIVDSSVLEYENELGDSIYHGLTVMLPGKMTLKTAVLPDMDSFSEISELFKTTIRYDLEFTPCSETEFSEKMSNSIQSCGLPLENRLEKQ